MDTSSVQLIFYFREMPTYSEKCKGCCSCRDPTKRFSSNSAKLLFAVYFGQNSKIEKSFTVKIFRQFLKALTVKLSVFKIKSTSYPEILIKVYK